MNQHPTPPTPPSQQADPLTTPAQDIKENKDIAALSYVWVLSLFVYFYRHASPFARFHAKQGIVLFIFSSICLFLPDFIGRLFALCILGFCVWGFLSAAQGKWKQLPLVFALSCGDMQALRTSWKEMVQSIVHVWKRIRKQTGRKTSSGAQSNADNISPTPPAL